MSDMSYLYETWLEKHIYKYIYHFPNSLLPNTETCWYICWLSLYKEYSLTHLGHGDIPLFNMDWMEYIRGYVLETC